MRSMEGGPDFGHEAPTSSLEHAYPNQGTAELLVVGLESAAEAMLNSPDTLTRIVGEKLADKARVKRQVEDILDGADDITRRQEFKKLGLFVIREQEARFSYADQEAGFAINEGDPYLELHLPPVPAELRSREEVERSLRLIAEYMTAHDINPKYLLGITYEKLGKVAKRAFGFESLIIDPELLPEDVVRGVERVYDDTGLYGDIGYPAIVYLDTEDLHERFDPDANTESRPDRGRSFALSALAMAGVALGAVRAAPRA